MPTPGAPVKMMRVDAAGQRYDQMDCFVFLGTFASEIPNFSV